MGVYTQVFLSFLEKILIKKIILKLSFSKKTCKIFDNKLKKNKSIDKIIKL